jgi:hypothetical protein
LNEKIPQSGCGEFEEWVTAMMGPATPFMRIDWERMRKSDGRVRRIRMDGK